MSNLVDKPIELYKDETLTVTLAKTGVLARIDTEGYDKMTIYPEYTPSTIGNVLITKLFFGNENSQRKNDDPDTGLLFHPEPHEVVAADGTATITAKVRQFAALTNAEEAAPVISMPINDKEVELFIAEALTGGGAHGTLTVTVRLARLGG